MFGTNYMYPYYGQQPYNNPMPDNLAQLRAQQQPQQQANNGIIWVQGEAGAKSYLVAPGNTVQLWDSENPTIYLKSADQSGVPSMRILDWTERAAVQKAPLQTAQQPTPEYVTRDEFNALEAKIAGLMQPKRKAKEETENA